MNNITSGIVYKWVNFGRGWRARWLVLEDGVLSYYKIHGPDKIVVDEETICCCKIIGLQTPMIVPKVNNVGSGDASGARKPLGEIHLKVSSIRESRSDDKRFSIFTGTKTLHLRAKTREDCLAWLDALQAAKGMFPRMLNCELMAPLDDVQVSTEKLRRRLLDEGVREEVIQESEEIMRSEFTALQNQIVELRRKQLFLIDMLRKFEVMSRLKARSVSARSSSTASVSPVLQNCKSMVQYS